MTSSTGRDPEVALTKLQERLPQGYDALVAYLGEDDTPFLMLHVPLAIWDEVRDQVTGWHWLDEVKVTLPFDAPGSIDGFRIMLEWEMPKELYGGEFFPTGSSGATLP